MVSLREDFHHKTSKALVETVEVLVFEDLRIKQMTKRPEAEYNEETGKTERKGVKEAKAGLNRAILILGWHQLHSFTEYKAYRAGKVTYKVSAYYSSYEVCRLRPQSPLKIVRVEASFVYRKCQSQGQCGQKCREECTRKEQSNGSWTLERVCLCREFFCQTKGAERHVRHLQQSADGAGRREASKNRAAHPARSSAL